MIREIKLSDAPQVAGIYNYYILNTCVTFEEETVTEQILLRRIIEITERYPWLVYEIEGEIKGYAHASAWKSCSAYKHSAEITVYLENGFSRKGMGTELYTVLLDLLRHKGLHAVIGGIALPNDGCIALHQKFGFENVARFKEVGHKFNKWIDVMYWEKILG